MLMSKSEPPNPKRVPPFLSDEPLDEENDSREEAEPSEEPDTADGTASDDDAAPADDDANDDEPKDLPPELAGAQMLDLTDADREALYRDVELQAEIERVLWTKLNDAEDVKDVHQEVRIAILKRKRLPAGRKARIAFLCVVARNKAVSHIRKRQLQVPVEDGADAEQVVAEEQPADAIIARDAFAKLGQAVPDENKQTYLWMLRHEAGEKITVIAREANLDADVVRKRIDKERLRTRQRALLIGALGFIALVGGAVSLFAAFYHPKIEMATPSPRLVASVQMRPAEDTRMRERDPATVARDIRAHAFKECLQNDWRACSEDLSAAAWLDPNGDQDAAVQAARQDADEGPNHLKPGDPWRPQFTAVYRKLAEK